MRTSFGWKGKAWFVPFADMCVDVPVKKLLKTLNRMQCPEVGFPVNGIITNVHTFTFILSVSYNLLITL